MNRKCVSLASLIVLAAGAGPLTVWAGSNQWTNIGPEGGLVGSLAVDPLNSRTVYAGTSAGVFKSQDGGASWSNSGLGGYTVVSLGIDPQDSNTVYAVTGQPDQNLDVVNVFRSTDGGTSWTEVDRGLPAGCCKRALVIDPIHRGTIYVVAETLTLRELGGVFVVQGGVRKSTDGGNSWQMADAGLPEAFFVSALAIDPQSSGTLYAAGTVTDSRLAAVFKSLDGGASWNQADLGLARAAIVGQIGPLTVDPKNPATVYLTFSPYGILKSVDGGSSWTAANSGIRLDQCCFGPVLIDGQDPNTLFVAGRDGGAFKSTDGGTNWIPLSLLPPFSPSVSIAIDPQDSNTLYAATWTGVLKSADAGATWIGRNSGLRAIAVFSLQIDPQNPRTVYAGTGYGGAFKSQDGGLNWLADNAGIKFQYGAGTVTALAIHPLAPANLFAGTSENPWSSGDGCGYGEGGVFKSADAGMSWTDTGLVGCVSAIAIDPKTPSTVYAASGDPRMGVVRSTDGGTNWTAVNAGLPPSIPIYREFPDPIALAIDPQTPGTLYVGVQNYVPSSPPAASLFKSANGGKTWTATGLNPSVLGAGYTFNLTIYPQGMDTVYVTAASYDRGGALWKSTDGGTSWRNLWPSSSTNVYAVIVAPDDPTVVYAGTDTGVVKSADSGATWTPIPGSPGYTQVLAFDPQNADTLYAAGPAGLFAITF